MQVATDQSKTAEVRKKTYFHCLVAGLAVLFHQLEVVQEVSVCHLHPFGITCKTIVLLVNVIFFSQHKLLYIVI